jgi:mono/diheme cytochrome c family protein
LILALAACSKQEPPPAIAATPAKAPDAPVPAVSTADRNVGAGLPRDTSAPAPVATTDLLKEGADLFAKTCATCHMADGSGVPYLQPSIKGSAWISNPDPQLLLSLILRGSAVLGDAAQAYDNDMAPQDHLSDTEVAAVATYVRSRFAAAPITEPVTPAQVAIARARPGLPE